MSMVSHLEVSGLNTVQFGSESLSGLITETFSDSKATRRLNRAYIIRHSAYNSSRDLKESVDFQPTVDNPFSGICVESASEVLDELEREIKNKRFRRCNINQARKLLGVKNAEWFVLRQDGRLMAYAIGIPENDGGYYLNEIGADEEMKGGGFKLMEHMEKNARDRGFKRFHFSSYSDDRSTQSGLDSFYEKKFVPRGYKVSNAPFEGGLDYTLTFDER